MAILRKLLEAVCDTAWIENQIKSGCKIGIIGKDCQEFVDRTRDENYEPAVRPINIWLAIVDDFEQDVHGETVLKLVWPDNVSNMEPVRGELGTWASYKSPIVPSLTIWLYKSDLGSHLPYRNSLQRGIVYSFDKMDDILTNVNKTNDTATTSYVSLNTNTDPPVVRRVTTSRLGEHSSPESLTLDCLATRTTSFRLPIQL